LPIDDVEDYSGVHEAGEHTDGRHKTIKEQRIVGVKPNGEGVAGEDAGPIGVS